MPSQTHDLRGGGFFVSSGWYIIIFFKDFGFWDYVPLSLNIGMLEVRVYLGR